jgi:haloacetate dehalogenase
VNRLAVLDIAPTAAMYGQTDMRFATAYYHWFYLIQPAPLPERMIGADAEFYLRSKCGQWGRTSGAITNAAFADYLRCFSQTDRIHAMCEDYRAAATIDLEHDEEERSAKLQMPLLALWGEAGFVGNNYDVLAEWRQVASDVSGHGVPGGHYLPEEAPEETLSALRGFFG